MNEGDAIFHVARFSRPTDVARALEEFGEGPSAPLDEWELRDEPEIR